MTEDKTLGALTCNEFEVRASQAMGMLYLQGHEALVKRDAAREEFLDAVAWLESLGGIILPAAGHRRQCLAADRRACSRRAVPDAKPIRTAKPPRRMTPRVPAVEGGGAHG